MSVVIPAKLINETAKIISDEGDDQMSFEIAEGKAVMKFDNNKVIINTFSGKFIDYGRILNKQGDINVRVKRNDILKSTELNDGQKMPYSITYGFIFRYNIPKL